MNAQSFLDLMAATANQLNLDEHDFETGTNKAYGKDTLQSRPSAAGMLLPSVHGCILSAS
ncbi:MAG: hypothetical protein PF589_06195 [Gammaproteobacteria bacterium]|jgi:hypothetical protein|nr:hypothetical protein [Gammaproteobacteria bacterium]